MMHYVYKQKAIAQIGQALANLGWNLWGYRPDRSDLMEDYYRPASWSGIATHADHPGVVIVVGAEDHDQRRLSGHTEIHRTQVPGQPCENCNETGIHPGGLTYQEALQNPTEQHWIADARERGTHVLLPNAVSPLMYHADGKPKCLRCGGKGHATAVHEEPGETWPTFQAVGKGRVWHVECNGIVVGSGRGYKKVLDGGVDEVVSEIIAIVQQRTTATAAPVSVESDGYTITHERDWTWITFSGKPVEAVREALKSLGFRWSKRRVAWYAMKTIDAAVIAEAVNGVALEAAA